MAFVSLTSITLNRFFYAPAFWYHALRSHRACIKSEGMIAAKLDSMSTTYSTMTIWNDKASMLRFMSHPHHLKAMKWSKNRTHGKTYHYESDALPSWDHARDLMARLGREV